MPACDHFGQELTAGKDDRVFVDRVKDACCRNEAVMKAIIIGITLMLSAAATRPSCCAQPRPPGPGGSGTGGGSVTAVVGERAGGKRHFIGINRGLGHYWDTAASHR